MTNVVIRGAIRLIVVSVIVALPVAAVANDRYGMRPYVALWAGGTSYGSDVGVPGLALTSPGQFPFPQFALGVDLDRNWSVELAVNYGETNIEVPGLTERIAEYATWSVLPQLRLRYPLLNDRLVPYVIGGVGIGGGELNDRNVLHANVDLGGSGDTSFVGSLGAGLEYFVTPSLALGVEAKHIFGLDTEIRYKNQLQSFDIDQTFYSAGFRLHFNERTSAGPDGPRPKGDGDGVRGYAAFRRGVAVGTGGDNFMGLDPSSPVITDFGAALGVNLGRHWGVEISGDYWEPVLNVPGIGNVAEYALYTTLLHLRYRYPIGDGRWVPYALIGGGLGFAEVNDRRVPFSDFQIQDSSDTFLVGSVGGGLEYFLQSNFAVGLEARYIFGFQDEVNVGGLTGPIDNDTMLVAAGIRVLFP